MSRRKMENLRDMLCSELDKIADKNSISAGDLEAAHKLTDTIKNIYKINMLDDQENGSSERYYKDDDRSYAREDRSYARDGQHYVRGHYSYDDYSGGSMRDHLNQMMREAQDDRTRDTIRRFMSELG